MLTEKRNAFLSGLCGFAVALGMLATTAQGIVTTERGASILAFPKVLATSDTIIQITNISNNMVHARCFYVDASPDFFGNPKWQVTDFTIWLTKQQPTHWQVSTGRFINPNDNCIVNGKIVPSTDCADAGLDPGAVPPVPEGFVGELKCVEVDVADNPIGGNHLKGEATIKSDDGDVAKYNAVGIQGTDLAGATGNELLLNQPIAPPDEDPVGQYDACPDVLLLNHLADGVTDPVVFEFGAGGRCDIDGSSCQSDEDCGEGPCLNGAQVEDPVSGELALRSASITDLTLIPCTQDFENGQPAEVTVQFEIFNEFEERFSTSTPVVCWKSFFLFQVDSPNDPDRSVFSFNRLGTTAAHTRIVPNPDGGAVIGVAGTTRADAQGNLARVLVNIHMERDRFSASGGEVIDRITLSDLF